MKRDEGGILAEVWIFGPMVLVALLLGGLLLSNQEGVKQRSAEVDRVQRDLVTLAEEIQQLSEMERDRAFSLVEQERLARERLRWTKPGEFVIRVEDP